MRKFLFIITAALTLAVCTAAASKSDKIRYETRKTARFCKIRIEGAPTVRYSQGNRNSVKVIAEAGKLSNVETRIEGETLVISHKQNNSNGLWIFGNGTDQSDIIVEVTSLDLTGVTVFGAGDFISNGHVDTDNLDIVLRGAGDIVFRDIICDNLKTLLIGSGDIDIKNVDALSSVVELVGSGDIDINLKNTKKTSIDLKGSGDISISFNNCGTAVSSLKGSGDITLKGRLKSLEKSSLGTGDYHTDKLIVK